MIKIFQFVFQSEESINGELSDKIDKLRTYLNPDNAEPEDALKDWKHMPQEEVEKEIVSNLLAIKNNERLQQNIPSDTPEANIPSETPEEEMKIELPVAPQSSNVNINTAYNDLSPEKISPIGNSQPIEDVKEIYGVEEYVNPPNYIVDPNPLDYLNAYVAAYANNQPETDFDYLSAIPPAPVAPVGQAPASGSAPMQEMVVSKETFNKMMAAETGGFGLNGDDYPERDHDRDALVLSNVVSAEDPGRSSSDESLSNELLERPPIMEPYEEAVLHRRRGNLERFLESRVLAAAAAESQASPPGGSSGSKYDESLTNSLPYSNRLGPYYNPDVGPSRSRSRRRSSLGL